MAFLVPTALFGGALGAKYYHDCCNKTTDHVERQSHAHVVREGGIMERLFASRANVLMTTAPFAQCSEEGLEQALKSRSAPVSNQRSADDLEQALKTKSASLPKRVPPFLRWGEEHLERVLKTESSNPKAWVSTESDLSDIWEGS